MNQAARIIAFPTKAKAKKQSRIKNIDGVKYFSSKQVKLLRRTVKDQAATGKMTAVREWMVIDLLTSTGLRVSEAADLRCGDLKLGYGDSRVFVRDGKGSISGHVIIPDSLKKHLKSYLKWKQEQGELTGKDDHLFIGQRGAITSQAIQQIVKKYLKQINIYESGKSVHALRHSYAMELYKREKDLRAVQKQLRHVSIQSTLVYADTTNEELASQVKGLWGQA
ncbi:MAG: integrase/recombinase XerD [Desulfobacteraceae bacterium Eth-SRB1]|nr:MAG: integrase/recombinase XerD [Desulfobacteraceae bacterium Eth-SRB1]